MSTRREHLREGHSISALSSLNEIALKNQRNYKSMHEFLPPQEVFDDSCGNFAIKMKKICIYFLSFQFYAIEKNEIILTM